jgi:hypothetical protein
METSVGWSISKLVPPGPKQKVSRASAFLGYEKTEFSSTTQNSK